MPGFSSKADTSAGSLQYTRSVRVSHRSSKYRSNKAGIVGAQCSSGHVHSACGVVVKPDAASLRFVSKPDVAFLLTEIYDKHAYLQHGISLHPGGTVVDVGANIGLFANYAAQHVGPAGRVIACEPIPPVFQAAQANVAALHTPGAPARPSLLCCVSPSLFRVSPTCSRLCSGEAAQRGRRRRQLQHC